MRCAADAYEVRLNATVLDSRWAIDSYAVAKMTFASTKMARSADTSTLFRHEDLPGIALAF